MLVNLKVSRVFTSYSDAGLDEFANGVVLGLTNNPGFPNPPVLAIDLAPLDSAFRAAIAACTGDPADTLLKKAAREALLEALRRDACYVESFSSHDEALMLSSGYFPASSNHVPYPLATPVIMALTNLAPGKLLLRLQRVKGAKTYHVEFSPDAGATWQDGVITTKSQHIELAGLTSTKSYLVRVRAIGGSTGCSEWIQSAPIVVT
jgi:hypothetical protein